jgi:hypothetical protein
MVSGPHFAGLAKISKLPSKTHVVEFVSISLNTFPQETRRTNYYLCLSQAAGYHHRAVEPGAFEFDPTCVRAGVNDVIAFVRRVLSKSNK